MKNFKAKYYLVFPYELNNQIKWPEGWGNKCIANIPEMLKEVIKVKRIGSEIKLIWNEHHRYMVMKDNNVTYKELEDYLKAKCTMLSFATESTMKKAVQALKNMGTKEMICVGIYRDVILQQAYFYNNKKFFYEK